MESLRIWIILEIVIAACIEQGLPQTNPLSLSSSRIAVLENSSVSLTCSSKTGTFEHSIWETSLYDNKIAACYRNETSCIKTGFLESASYDCTCYGNGSFTVQLKHLDRHQYGSTWTCKSFFEKSNTIVINVTVPVTNAILTRSGNELMYENNNVTFTCTSYSLPAAQIRWYRSYRTSIVEITYSRNIKIKRETHTREDNVIRIMEILSFKINRSANGWNIYCTATHLHIYVVTSDKIELSVIYPPETLPLIDGFSNGSTYKVIENETASLSCSIKGGNPLANPEWHCERINRITSKERITDNETVTSNLFWTVTRTDGKICTCFTGHLLSNDSIYVNIDVLYPPGKPTIQLEDKQEKKIIISDVQIIEYKSYRFLCMADSNPPSEYSWHGPQTTDISHNASVALQDVKRTQNGTYICHARTTMRPTYGENRTKENNSSVNVDILYPPDIPPVIYGVLNGSTYRVIENDMGNLSCSIKEGNPLARVEWHCERINNLTLNKRITNTVESTSSLFWIAKRTDGKMCTCTMVHELLNVSIYVQIDVLYPPESPHLQLEHGTERKNVTLDAKLIEHKSYRLLCMAVSNPSSEYIWDGPQITDLLHNASVDLSGVQRIHNGTYTCFARNTMHPTFAEIFTKENASSINVEILYKPTLAAINKQGIAEGATLNISCEVISANPSDINFTWTRDTAEFQSNSKELVLQNVSRHDAMNYTCTVNNYMIPTVGEVEEGYASETFYLNVWYRASVTKFVVNGHEHDMHIETYESNIIKFICKIDSNPNSTVKLITPNGTELISTGTNVFEYDHFLSTCVDNGKYTCSGSNAYNNGQPGVAELSVFVKCTPMAHHHIKKDVRSELYVPVILQFRALAYPEPEFTWEKWENSSWEKITNDSMFSISSLKLQSNLTVIHFTSTTASVYRLMVENEVGTLIQNYTLKPFDHPETPTEFRHIKEVLTDTSITLLWKAGFNGGMPQTFILTYRKEVDQDWRTITLLDTGETVINVTIHGLSSSTNYEIVLVAINDKGSSGNVTLQIETKEMAEVVTETGSIVGSIVGSISGALVVMFGALIGILLYRKRSLSEKESESSNFVYQNVQFAGKRPKKKLTAKVPSKIETSFQTLQEPDDAPPIYKEPTEDYNSPDKVEHIERIQVSELLPFVLGSSEESFAIEYQKLPTGLQKPCVFARRPENIVLNRYNGIYPYDHSRVKIPGRPDFFINACYIDGYTKQSEYIASLGPTEVATYEYKTFWLMVWNERSDIIVMLTNLMEPSGMKCEQYWPELGTIKTYGDIQVTFDKEETFAEYTTRSFIISNTDERRSVTHLHYTSWPDKRVPENATSLIEFRQRLKITPTAKKGPIIIHCSAGIGRTGTLIALDRLIQEGQCESSVDVFKCVNSMREQRVNMVQTLEQYIYIFKALVNSLYFESEMIPIESFREYVDTTNNNIYSRQFQQLKDSVETCCKEEIDAHTRNEMLVDKNRKGSDIPGNQNRVYLYQNRNADMSDYINAVYASSFKKKDHFILAQSPLPGTVSDFVCMMYQENCCCVVTMEDLKEPGLSVGHYLPNDGQSQRFGDIKITCLTLETKPQYTVKEIRMQNCGQFESREKIAYHFQYNKWMKGNDTPANAEGFVQFIRNVEEYSDQLGEEESHVLVHCLKANKKSALYCIVSILMEKMRYERQVSVLNTVRHLRTRRRTAIISMEQLKFCYEAVKAYIDSSES